MYVTTLSSFTLGLVMLLLKIGALFVCPMYEISKLNRLAFSPSHLVIVSPS